MPCVWLIKWINKVSSSASSQPRRHSQIYSTGGWQICLSRPGVRLVHMATRRRGCVCHFWIGILWWSRWWIARLHPVSCTSVESGRIFICRRTWKSMGYPAFSLSMTCLMASLAWQSNLKMSKSMICSLLKKGQVELYHVVRNLGGLQETDLNLCTTSSVTILML